MRITIHRGTKEIGGTLIELEAGDSKVLLDAGYPLFLSSESIKDEVSTYPLVKLLEMGVLPDIKGLYKWDLPQFDAVIISHAHIDHYGLLRFINSAIPVYLSKGTNKIIEISLLFGLYADFNMEFRYFEMYKAFNVKLFRITPYLMDHSAFDASCIRNIIRGQDFNIYG
ncbi:MAG: MBL fold metallo-hydrolase [Christensenellales bacterium]